MKPLVTIGCVTNRPWCHDWLLWNIEKQTYPNLEIVVINQHAPGANPYKAALTFNATALGRKVYTLGPQSPPVQWHGIEAAATMPCGELRNDVLAVARGKFLCWFDDDDWQHPEKVAWMVEELEKSKEPWMGWTGGWLWSLHSPTATRIGWKYPRISNGAALYRTELVRETLYDHGKVASDGRWIRALMAKHKTRGRLLSSPDRVHSIWSRHAHNLVGTFHGVSVSKRDIIALVGADAWGDSSERYAELAERFKAVAP